MTKSQYTNKKQLAQILFNQGYTQKAIASMIEVSEVTISKWAKIENWDKVKTNLTTSRHNRLSELYDELAEMNTVIANREEGKRFANSKEADSRRKLVADIKDLEGKYSIGEAISIGREFTNFVAETDYELAKQVVSFYDEYINGLLEKQKWGE
ncbi:MAG: DDE transposase family protein [Lentimicrobium sp.]|jgi:predicted transcriptional regulator|nr:DDE transposase family protein [Lentimicrobium sp.]